MIKVCNNLLKENGYLILTTPNKPQIEKLVKKLSISRDKLQPIENWLDERSLISLLNPHFKLLFVGSLMFYPVFIRKYKLFDLIYGNFYNRVYKIIDRLLKSGNQGLYLGVVARKQIYNRHQNKGKERKINRKIILFFLKI